MENKEIFSPLENFMEKEKFWSEEYILLEYTGPEPAIEEGLLQKI